MSRAQRTRSKLIKAQAGFEEEDSSQPETQTCPATELQPEGKGKSLVFAWRLYSTFDIASHTPILIVYFIAIS